MTEPYDSGAALDDRLSKIFSQYRPIVEPDDDGDYESADDFLRRTLSPDEWARIEAHRERQYAESITRQNAEALMAAWQELADAGVEMDWQTFTSRAAEADNPFRTDPRASDADRATAQRERHATMANDAAEAARQRYDADLRESLAGLPGESE